MNSFVNALFLICVLTSTTNPSCSEEDVVALNSPNYGIKTVDGVQNFENTHDTIATEDKHSKPLRSIFLGIYKNYKSTYLGNKTLTEYKQTLRETLKNKQQLQQNTENNEALLSAADEDEHDGHYDGVVTEYLDDEESITLAPENQELLKQLAQNRKRKNQEKNSKSPIEHNKQEQYHIGPALNLSLDMDNSIVKVNIDGESLKELVTGRWLNDNSEEGNCANPKMILVYLY